MPSWNLPWAYSTRASKPSPLDNPSFRNWFWGSVVRNPDKTPKVMYHGTTARGEPRWDGRETLVTFPSAFTVFRPGDEDIGIHVGTREQANSLVEERAAIERGGWRGHIYPVYVSLKNPIRMVDTGQWFPFEIAQRLEDRWPRNRVFDPVLRPPILTPEEVERVVHTTDTRGHSQARKVLVSLLNAHGYDGVVYQNLYEGNKKDDSYIVFDPAQIKSAYGNRGTFDPDDPDILNGVG